MRRSGGAASTWRFALLAHDCPTPGFPNPHFDLLIEDPALLPTQGPGERRCRTWRLHADPRAGSPVRCEPIAPHRAFYLDYEGPVSGARGTVTRLDGGTVVWESGVFPGEGPAVIVLNGERLVGRWRADERCFSPLP
ncbi:hypothetical protein LzC2_35440 [Planctomycetes bacterium LzC2]|uniref:Uncharacterized protein n=1 Tax=Alienimonas chondri TaxID=2681879 RepID=A0ABX1VIS8_9PLAN|nr:hypothetical protein [Alienimonas chondri]